MHVKLLALFNPIALRTAKTLWSFGCSECNRVKIWDGIGQDVMGNIIYIPLATIWSLMVLIQERICSLAGANSFLQDCHPKAVK